MIWGAFCGDYQKLRESRKSGLGLGLGAGIQLCELSFKRPMTWMTCHPSLMCRNSWWNRIFWGGHDTLYRHSYQKRDSLVCQEGQKERIVNVIGIVQLLIPLQDPLSEHRHTSVLIKIINFNHILRPNHLWPFPLSDFHRHSAMQSYRKAVLQH